MSNPHYFHAGGPASPSESFNYQVKTILTETLQHRIRKSCSGVIVQMGLRENVSKMFVDDFEVEVLLFIEKTDKDLKVPLTWWDHFKLTYFKGKLLERFPVQYRTIHARVLFPDIPVDLANKTNTITYVVKK